MERLSRLKAQYYKDILTYRLIIDSLFLFAAHFLVINSIEYEQQGIGQ